MIDVDLLHQYASRRDAEAFALLVQRYQRLIFATCRRQLHDPADVDDAVQETFLRLAKSAGTLRSNVGGWLHRSATHVSTDLNRRRRTRSRYEAAAAPARGVTPDQSELMEMREQLDRAMEKLDADDRELIVQRFFVGRAQIELATEAGVAASTISQRLDRAIDRLRQHMGTAGYVLAVAALVSGLEKEAAAAVVPPELTAKLTSVGLSGLPGPVAVGGLAMVYIVGGAFAVFAFVIAGLIGVWFWSHSPVQAPVSATAPVEAPVVALTVASGGNGPLKAAPQWKPAANAADDSPLSGHVVDRQGKPIAGAVVRLTDADYASATTDAHGQYDFDPMDLKDGKCQIGVTAKGYLPVMGMNGSSPELMLSTQTQAVRDFVLDRGVVVTIAVRDEDGELLTNAEVDVSGPGSTARSADRIITDRTGIAEITLPASQSVSTVAISLDGYAPVHQEVTPASVDQPMDLKIVLPVGISVPGIAICSDGKPATGWQIGTSPKWWDGYRSLPSADIDRNGKFNLTHIIPGDYELEIWRPEVGYGEGNWLGMFTLPPKDGGVLRLDIPGPSKDSLPELTGKVRLDGPLNYGLHVSIYSKGSGFEGRMQMVQQGGLVPAEKTKAGLPFTIANLPPGIYQVRFQGQEIKATTIADVKIPGKPLIVDIKVAGTPHLLGTVLDPSGKPITQFAVRIRRTASLDDYSNYGQDAGWMQFNDPDGKFDIELVGSGVFEAQASAVGYAWVWGPETRAELGAKPQTTIHLVAGGSLHGSVVDLASHAIAGANVIPISMSIGEPARFEGDGGAVVTDASGQFVFPHLIAGTEKIKIIADNFMPRIVADLKIVDGKTTEAGKIALHVGGAVAGIAYDGQGQPAPGLTVEIQDDQFYHPFEEEHAAHLVASAVTDSTGHFRMDHLPVQDIYVVKSYMSLTNRDGVVQRVVHPIDGQTIECNLGGPTAVRGRLIYQGKSVAKIRVTLSVGDPNSGTTVLRGSTDADGRFAFFGPPPGDYTLFRENQASMNREMVLGDFKIGSGDIGDVVQDTGELVIHLAADDPADLEAIDEIEIDRRDTNDFYKSTIGSAGRDDADRSIWRAKDVPAAPLRLTLLTKDLWTKGGHIFRAIAERKPGVDSTSVVVQIPRATATLSLAVSISGAIVLRRDDEAYEVRIIGDAGKASTVQVPPGNYRVIDVKTDKPRGDMEAIHAEAGKTTGLQITVPGGAINGPR